MRIERIIVFARLLLRMRVVRIIVSTLHLLGPKSATPLSFAIGWGLTTVRDIFFEPSTFLVVKDRDSLTIAILLAGYRMILTSKTIEDLSH